MGHVPRPADRPFVFTHSWNEPGAPAAVYARWSVPEGFPGWWPQVRAARRTGDGAGSMVVRSLLPVPLRFSLRRVVEDPVGRRLVARSAGDLVGTIEVRVVACGGGSRIVWRQRCRLAHPVLRHALWVPGARAVLRANHAWMMRGARQA